MFKFVERNAEIVASHSQPQSLEVEQRFFLVGKGQSWVGCIKELGQGNSNKYILNGKLGLKGYSTGNEERVSWFKKQLARYLYGRISQKDWNMYVPNGFSCSMISATILIDKEGVKQLNSSWSVLVPAWKLPTIVPSTRSESLTHPPSAATWCHNNTDYCT